VTMHPSHEVITKSSSPEASRNKRTVVLFAVAALLLLALGAIPRILRAHRADDVVHASPVLYPEVLVVHPQSAPSESIFSIPGDLQALYTASIFSRTNGYVEKRFVDIGSHVKAGELLALVSAPEVDRQLDQVRASATQADAALQEATASLQQAEANVNLARITRDRYAKLQGTRAITQQSFDEADQTYNARVADVAAAKAHISVAKANLQARTADMQRTSQLKGFERIVAPFEGVITARNVEQGDLVNDGSDNGAKSLFTVAQSGKLRVQAEVPQSAALALKAGQQAVITADEVPGRKYLGTITRTAESVDTNARTMLTEVQVDNRDGSLLPGMYGQVTFHIPQLQHSFVIPATALVIDKNGMHVVTVSADNKVHFVPVDIGQDMGANVEIATGLHGGESLVTNPSDLLTDGEQVTIAQP
jgi:RND family efflux transporter MFP subunit